MARSSTGGGRERGRHEEVSAVWNAQPPQPYDSPVRGLASAIEWNVGLGFSWLPYIGQWNRLARDERTALFGTYLGWGVLLNIAAILGALTALLVGTYEPTEWMIQAGGAIFGLLGLFMLILANLTSATVLIYSQSLSIKTLFPRWSWRTALLTTVPAALLMLTPAFYDRYTAFLAYISFIMAAYGGVLVADYVFIQRFHISLRDLYEKHAGRYQYLAGFNWEAYVAIILGGLFYFWTYDPATDRAGPLFTYITAGIPTFFLTAAVYLGLTFLTRRLSVQRESAVPVAERSEA
jgi:purine-cytosine permease-like protein